MTKYLFALLVLIVFTGCQTTNRQLIDKYSNEINGLRASFQKMVKDFESKSIGYVDSCVFQKPVCFYDEYKISGPVTAGVVMFELLDNPLYDYYSVD